LTALFGFIGYVMKKYDWPRPVVVIGLVLAKIAEKNLILSLRLFQLSFLLRPITLMILLLVILSIIYMLRSRRVTKGGVPA
jgi:putative tricarboxylic transport membrane protein